MLVSSFFHGKPEGLCHLLKCIHGALCCQMLQVRRDDISGSRVCRIHSYHAPHKHLFMHSSISPMIDVGVLIQIGIFILVNMGSDQTPLLKKRFYQVKIKNLEVTSLQELGQLMGQLQWQAFHKAYGKICDLATVEVSMEAIASLTQYYDQPLRCFTFEDFQLVSTVKEFEEILGCPLGGRKPYLFSGFYPSTARITKVVKISAQELDRAKQNRNGVVGVPRKCLEEKANALANQGEWASFIKILALLIFGVALFPNVERLVDLVAIDAFLAFHNSKESLVVAILANMYDTFDQRCEKSGAKIVCCTPALYVWLVSHLFPQEGRPGCPLQGHHLSDEKGKANWDQLLASMEGASINWFPHWKEGRIGILCSCKGFPNVPLMGTRGCINYNPILSIRQLGYPMRGVPSEESIAPFIARGFSDPNARVLQGVHKAWDMVQRNDKELRGSSNGIIGAIVSA